MPELGTAVEDFVGCGDLIVELVLGGLKRLGVPRHAGGLLRFGVLQFLVQRDDLAAQLLKLRIGAAGTIGGSAAA